MNYLTQILFFFGAIGVFNSFIVALYLLASKSYSGLSNRLFGLFLLVLSLRVLKSLFYAFSTQEPVWFLQSGPSFFLLIGPLFFSYIISVVRSESIWLRCSKYHILFWGLTILGLMIFTPFTAYVELNKGIILPVINLQWLIYLFLAGFITFQKYKADKIDPVKFRWLVLLFSAVLVLWGAFAFVKFDYFVSGSILFSVLFYSFFCFFHLRKKVTSKIFEKNKQRKLPKNVIEEAKRKIEQLAAVMVDEKPYVNPDLKLSDLSRKLELTPHELSRLINIHIGKKFADYINEYRIEEAKRLIQNNSLYTIEAIGNEAGFNSKSAFYKAFKKVCGVTPAKYKSQI